MRVKLLKKIRKEFSINHYPNGIQKKVPGFVRTMVIQEYGPNTYTLERNGNVLSALDLSKHWVDKTPQEIYSDLLRLMSFHIREFYSHHGTRRINKVKKKQQPNKLWYQIKKI
jgi:hypothetical protein